MCPGVRRGWWFTLALAVLASVHMFGALTYGGQSAVSSLTVLYVVTAGTGLCYGTMFCISFGINLEFFGIDSFATNIGFMITSAGVGGSCFNFICAAFYQMALVDETTNFCYGAECYSHALLMSSLTSAAATVLSVRISLWTKPRLF